MLRRRRHEKLSSLLASADRAVAKSALRAMRYTAQDIFTGSGADDAVAALMRHYVGAQAWEEARALVVDLATREAAGKALGEMAGSASADLGPMVPVLRDAAKAATTALSTEPFAAAKAALDAILRAMPRP